MIELTVKGQRIWLNTQHIIYMCSDNNGTKLIMTDGVTVWVDESMDQISSLFGPVITEV